MNFSKLELLDFSRKVMGMSEILQNQGVCPKVASGFFLFFKKMLLIMQRGKHDRQHCQYRMQLDDLHLDPCLWVVCYVSVVRAVNHFVAQRHRRGRDHFLTGVRGALPRNPS